MLVERRFDVGATVVEEGEQGRSIVRRKNKAPPSRAPRETAHYVFLIVLSAPAMSKGSIVPHNRKRHRRIHRPSARNRRRHSPGRHADVSDSSAPTCRRPGGRSARDWSLPRHRSAALRPAIPVRPAAAAAASKTVLSLVMMFPSCFRLPLSIDNAELLRSSEQLPSRPLFCAREMFPCSARANCSLLNHYSLRSASCIATGSMELRLSVESKFSSDARSIIEEISRGTLRAL
jgi:hypothetical protein